MVAMNDLNMKQVGRNIKLARTMQGLTQKELGRRCGIAYTSVRRYEAGLVSMSVPMLYRFAQALRLQPSDLMFATGTNEDQYNIRVTSNVYENAFRQLHLAGFSCEPVQEEDDNFAQDEKRFYIYETEKPETRVVMDFSALQKILDKAYWEANAWKCQCIRRELGASPIEV